MSKDNSGQVITFYSYKGGSGRTMALANIAVLLAKIQEEKEEKNVLMIDWDLEAPGLHRYFANHFSKSFPDSKQLKRDLDLHPGLLELFQKFYDLIPQNKSKDSQEESVDVQEEPVDAHSLFDQVNLDDYILDSDISHLSLLKAGSFNGSYSNRVNTFPWDKLYFKVSEIFPLFAHQLAKKYSFVLVDSRTGIADISNISTMLIPEKIVLVFTPNVQSLTGLESLIRNALNERRGSNDPRRLVIFPLPSRIEVSEAELRENWRFGDINDKNVIGYEPFFERIFREVYRNTQLKLNDYFDTIQIPHIPRYAFGENIAALVERDFGNLSLTRTYLNFISKLQSSFPWEKISTKEMSLALTRDQQDVVNKTLILEVEALCGRSSNLRQSDDYLGALMSAVKAANIIKHEQDVPDNLSQLVVDALSAVNTIQELNRFEGHSDSISGICISSSDQWIVSASHDSSMKLWRRNGTLVKDFRGHKGVVWDVCISPTTNLIASIGGDKFLMLWKFDSTDPIKSWEAHDESLLGVTFSSDGKMIASCGADSLIKIWDLEGNCLHTLEGHSDSVWDISFCHKGNFLASCGDDKSIKIWNLLDDSLVKTIQTEEEIYCINYSPNSKQIVTSGNSKTAKIWSINDDNSINDTNVISLDGHRDKIWSATFNPEGNWIATASADRTIRIWDHEGNELKTIRGHNSDVLDVVFTNNGDAILSSSSDNTVRLWQLREEKRSTTEGHKGKVTGVCFSPTGDYLASCSTDKTVKFWDLYGNLRNTFSGIYGHGDRINSVSIQPQLINSQREIDRLIASASDDRTIKLWKRSSATKPVLTIRHKCPAHNVVFSPDGQLIASSGDDNTIKLWDLSGQLIRNLEGHQEKILCLCFSSNGHTIASSSVDKTVRLWDIEGQTIRVFNHYQNPVTSVDFCPVDDLTLVSASSDCAQIVNLEDENIEILRGHEDVVYSVCFSPDGQTISSASNDQTVRVWSKKGTLLHTFYGHSARAVDVTFSPDGQRIASSSYDRTIKIWNYPANLNEVLTLPVEEMNIDVFLGQACDWLTDFLKTNQSISLNERRICESMVFSRKHHNTEYE